MYDCGLVSTKEPFKKLVNQGMILGENNEKMSKSRGNVVNPDDVIREWGADSLRLYEMFMGPLEAMKPWQMAGIGGCFRFLKRAWRMIVEEDGSLATKVQQDAQSEELSKALHKTIKKVTDDIEHLRLNTAISAMMEFVNAVYKDDKGLTQDSARLFVKLLSPFAPHMGEELWERLGGAETVSYEPWPTFDPALVEEDVVTLAIMVNGKKRGTLDVAPDAAKDAVLSQAKAVETVARHLEGKTLKKEIFVPGKIVSFVVAG